MQLLSITDPDSWVGRKVSIITGRNAGQIGIVMSSGNGWVQVDTPSGEVPKRAYELETVPDDTPLQGITNGQFHGYHEDTQQEPRKVRRLRDLEDVHEAASSNASQQDTHTITNEDYPDPTDAYPKKSKPLLSNPLPRRKPTNRHALLVEARRKHLSKYVHKQLSKIDKRPNLSDWQIKLNAVLFPTRDFEIRTTRMFDENYCPVCMREKWVGATFCWNEDCASSPVYYRLTGADLSPHNQNSYAVALQTADADAESINEAMMDTCPPVVSNSNQTSTAGSPTVFFRQVQPNPMNTYLMDAPQLIIGDESELQKMTANELAASMLHSYGQILQNEKISVTQLTKTPSIAETAFVKSFQETSPPVRNDSFHTFTDCEELSNKSPILAGQNTKTSLLV